MNKAPIPDSLRRRVFKRDNYTCRYCGATGVSLHADHVYPESKGGETTLENLVSACPNCNMSKSNKVGIWPMPLEQAQRMSSSQQYYQRTAKFLYYVFLGNLTVQERAHGIKETYPKLSTNDIAIILESSPAYVSEVLNTVEVEAK